MSRWTTIAPWRLGACQTVAIGASAAVTATAFNAQTHALLLTPTSDCHVVIGKSPTATSSTTLLKAGVPYTFGCADGDSVSVIQDSASGTLYVTELTH